jgi:hypothetical protein
MKSSPILLIFSKLRLYFSFFSMAKLLFSYSSNNFNRGLPDALQQLNDCALAASWLCQRGSAVAATVAATRKTTTKDITTEQHSFYFNKMQPCVRGS